MAAWYRITGNLPDSYDGCIDLKDSHPVYWEKPNAELGVSGRCRKIPLSNIHKMKACGAEGKLYKYEDNSCADSDAEPDPKVVQMEACGAAGQLYKLSDNTCVDPTPVLEGGEEDTTEGGEEDTTEGGEEDDTFIGSPLETERDSGVKLLALLIIFVLVYYRYQKPIRKFFK